MQHIAECDPGSILSTTKNTNTQIRRYTNTQIQKYNDKSKSMQHNAVCDPGSIPSTRKHLRSPPVVGENIVWQYFTIKLKSICVDI